MAVAVIAPIVAMIAAPVARPLPVAGRNAVARITLRRNAGERPVRVTPDALRPGLRATNLADSLVLLDSNLAVLANVQAGTVLTFCTLNANRTLRALLLTLAALRLFRSLTTAIVAGRVLAASVGNFALALGAGHGGNGGRNRHARHQ